MRPGKTQRPLLPPETLRRDRLFDWLATGIRRRVTYVIAEAGFGKTTLIADYLRSSRIRTQYAHYSTVMREQLGVEPPPLESI